MLARQVGAESLVQAIVCREGATLTITQPVSDSIVVETALPIAGTVIQANQIEVTIDGQFDGVIPLNAAATTFTTTVQLTPGTHTIRLMAVDACQIANASDQVVVTYQAPPTNTTGSVGGETKTALPAGGVVIGPQATSPGMSAATLSPFQRFVQPLVGVGRSLDLINGPLQSGVPQLIRFSFVTMGLGAIIFATQLAQFGSALHLGSMRLRFVHRLVPVLIGTGLLLLAFLL